MGGLPIIELWIDKAFSAIETNCSEVGSGITAQSAKVKILSWFGENNKNTLEIHLESLLIPIILKEDLRTSLVVVEAPATTPSTWPQAKIVNALLIGLSKYLTTSSLGQF